jgi:hypothetical protein
MAGTRITGLFASFVAAVEAAPGKPDPVLYIVEASDGKVVHAVAAGVSMEWQLITQADAQTETDFLTQFPKAIKIDGGGTGSQSVTLT